MNKDDGPPGFAGGGGPTKSNQPKSAPSTALAAPCQDSNGSAQSQSGMLGRATLTVSEAAAVLGISRGLAYELARQEKLPVIRLGRRIIVPRAALERLLEATNGN